MKKSDIWIIVLVLILAVGFFSVNRWMNSNYDARIVEVIDSGEVIYTGALDEIDEESFRIDTDQGYNIIWIHQGVVTVIEADCRDQVCVLSRDISQPGESIVCLPHELIVRIVGTQTGDVDVISN